MEKVQYKITNITRWAGAKKGKHRLGFILAVNRRNIHVNRHMVVPEITESIESWHSRKWVKIEAIENRHVSIKEATEKTEAENQKERELMKAQITADKTKEQKHSQARAKKEIDELQKAQVESQSASSSDKDALKAQLKSDGGKPKIKVTGPGNEGDNTDPMSGLESSEYIGDKEPNFVVNASKRKRNKNN